MTFKERFDIFCGTLSGAEMNGNITNLIINRREKLIIYNRKKDRCLIEYDKDNNTFFFTEHKKTGPKYVYDFTQEALIKKIF